MLSGLLCFYHGRFHLLHIFFYIRSLQLPIPQLHRLKMPPFFSALYTFQQIVSFTHRHNLAKKRDRCDNICINLFAYRNYVVVRCKSHDFFTFWIHRYDFSFKFCVWKCWNGLYFSTKKASVPLKGQKLNIILKYSGIKKLCIQHHICIQSSLFIIILRIKQASLG